MTDAPDPVALLALAAATAREAGALLLSRRDAVHQVGTKTSETDVVTEMDRAAEALIVARILETRPGDGILGEEGAARPATTGVRWVIDPLDGTVNYLYRIPHWAVSIAAEVDGDPVVAAVFDPSKDELFEAARGHGATLNGAPIQPSVQADVAQALVGTGFAYDAAVRRLQGPAMARLAPAVRDLRRGGSAALDLCWVACGRLDAYYERGVQPWDVSAASLLVREAGGVSGTLEGTPMTSSTTWIASNAALADVFRALVTEVSRLP